MDKRVIGLIDIYTKLLEKKDTKARDLLWSIQCRYDNNSTLTFVIEHEGTINQIGKELSYSQNSFLTYQKAERELKNTLISWISKLLQGYIDELELMQKQIAEGKPVKDIKIAPYTKQQLNKFEKEIIKCLK